MRFYLLGYPVGHSVSPAMHNAAFKELGYDHGYQSLSVEPVKLGETIQSKVRVEGFGGANVTIPHKISMLGLVDELDVSARQAGAVNTLRWEDDVLTGFNTDATGGVRALMEAYGKLCNAKVTILGAGGASNALSAQLSPLVKELTILNRTVDKAKALAERIDAGYGSLTHDQGLVESADIVINATPIGMHPNVTDSPIDKRHLNDEQLVFDIVYNPLKTQLMTDAEIAGARTLGGLWMLVYQGVESFEIWTGVKPDPQTMYDAAKKSLQEVH